MSNAPIDGKLVLLGEDNSGRDEMNLAGNPFALLQAASKSGQTFIRNEWERQLPNGKVVTAKWEVNGHAELGLPGPNEELLYLVLLQITREAADKNGEWPQEVAFSRGDLLNRLKWVSNGNTFQNLADAFNRLHAVTITAHNSFYDIEAKSPMLQVGFSLIDNYKIVEEPPGVKSQSRIPLSRFKWNDVVWRSMVSGNVRSLALDFAISLELPTSVRLFRFLDMMRNATTPPRREFAIGVFKLREKLGMTEYKYVSKVKEKLEKAIDELAKLNYLEGVRYQKSKDGVEIAYFAFGRVTVEHSGDTEVIPASGRVVSLPRHHGSDTKGTRGNKGQKGKDVSFSPSGENDQTSDIRADALKCHEVFKTLPEAEQAELMALALAEVSPIWHDRVGLPESPMSLGLWQLVAKRYPDRTK